VTDRKWHLRQTAAIGVATLVAVLCLPAPAYADRQRDRSWQLDALHVAEAQKISTGTGVVVAVVDTGVNGKQPELTNTLLPGIDTARGFTGNGQLDGDGHGTGIATLIAGHGTGPGNRDGILGIAPGANILPICTAGPSDDNDATADGVDWAVDHHAKVINLSFGGYTTDKWEKALDKALAADIVVVAATGNTGERTEVSFPATYPGVLAVTGSNREGEVDGFSLTGPRTDLTAPSKSIPVPDGKGGYQIVDGTSVSAALVSGVVALVRAKYPNLSAREVIHRIEATADDRGAPGRDGQYGWGIVNPLRALTEDVPPLSASPTANPSRSSTAARKHGIGRDTLLVVGGMIAIVLIAAAGVTVALAVRRA